MQSKIKIVVLGVAAVGIIALIANMEKESSTYNFDMLNDIQSVGEFQSQFNEDGKLGRLLRQIVKCKDRFLPSLASGELVRRESI